MNILVLGMGEIGKAITTVLGTVQEYKVKGWDISYTTSKPQDKFDVLHICYPFTQDFVSITNKYIAIYQPEITIIHSTVKVGTTRQINGKKVHIPILGRHESLAQHIEIFPMSIGYEYIEEWEIAFKYMSKTRVWHINPYYKYETTELCKLLSLVQFAFNIEYARYANKCCEQLGVDNSLIKSFTNGYNSGMEKLGSREFIKSILEPPKGKIGGHCVLPAVKNINDQIPETLLGRILEINRNMDN